MELRACLRHELVQRGIHGFALTQATEKAVARTKTLLAEIVLEEREAALRRMRAYEHMDSPDEW